MKKRKLAVLVPWDSPFMYTYPAFNLMNLQHPEGYEVRYFMGSGWCPAARHNDALARGLNWGAHACVFMGADHHCDEDILVKLMGHLEDGYDMATSWVPSRGTYGEDTELVFPFLAFRMKDIDEVHNLGAREILQPAAVEMIVGPDVPSQEIHIIGTGNLMFKVDVVRDMKLPWFREVLKADDRLFQRHFIQDCYFVFRCTVLGGATLWLDTTIDVKHMMVMPIDETYSERFADKARQGWSPLRTLGVHPWEKGDSDAEVMYERVPESFYSDHE